MDDLDTIAKERAVLREKLDLLTEQETEEQQRLEAEEAAAKKKQRRALLLNVATKASGATKRHQQLTDQAAEKLGEVAELLIQREQALSREAVGLNGPEFFDLLTGSEQSELLAKLERSAVGIYRGEFSCTWQKTVTDRCQDDQKLRGALVRLVENPQSHHKPLAGANNLLVIEAERLANSEPARVESMAVEVEPEKRAGEHYEADLRTPGPAIVKG